MSAFKDQLAADLAGVFFNADEFADQVTYTPKGGVAKSIPMIIDYGTGDGEKGADDLNTDAVGQIMAADIAQAQTGDTVTIGTASWVVEFGKLIDDGLIWQVYMSRVTR